MNFYKLLAWIFSNCLLLTVINLKCYSQTFFPIHYTTIDGLPSNTIYKISQDSEGYIWIATKNGLCSFNGQKFNSYYTPKMHDQDIMQLDAAPDTALVGFVNLSGQLGLASRDGIKIIDLGKTKHIQYLDLAFDDRKNLWVWERNCKGKQKCHTTLIQYNLRSQEQKRINAERNALADLAWDKRKESVFIVGQYIMDYQSNGQLSTYFDLAHFGERPRFQSINPLGRSPFPKGEEAWFFLINIKDSLTNDDWIQLAFWENDNPRLVQWSNAPPSFSLFTIVQASNGKYWIGSNQGLYEATISPDGRGTLLNRYLPNTFVQTLLLDREENLWIGSRTKGLYLLPVNRNPVYSRQLLGYADKGPRKLAANKLGIWGISGEGSLLRIKPDGKVKSYFFPKLKEFNHVYNGQGDELLLSSDRLVYSFEPIKQKIIPWDEKELKRRGFSFSKNFVPPTCSKDILFNKGSIWIASCQRFFQLDLKNKNASGLFWGRATATLHDSLRSLYWISTSEGILTYSKADSIQLVRDKNGNSLEFLAYCMAQDRRANIYFGTHGKGLWCWKNGEFQEVFPSNKQLGKTYSDILVCGDWLWTISEKGLIRINLASNEINPVSGPGLNSELYNFVKWGKYIWVSSSEGIIKLPITFEPNSSFPKRVFLEKFEAQNNYGEAMKSKDLPYRYNQITIDFSSPIFGSKANFQYRLNQGNWLNINQPPLLLSALKPGQYSVQIRTKESEASGQNVPLLINFKIENPFWLRIEFIVTALLLTGGLILLFARNFYRQRYRRFEEKERMLREIEGLRIKALQAQMNPHFTFNALNAIQDQLLNNDSLAAVNYLADFARLIRRSLDMVDRSYVSLGDEIEFLQTYIRLESIRKEKQVEVIWEIDKSLDTLSTFIPPMLIQPLIENSFKHGFLPQVKHPKINISVFQEGKNIVFIIEDNGVGPIYSMNNKRENHEAYGTRLIKERLAILPKEENQQTYFSRTDLSLEGPSQGTRSKIILPINSDPAQKTDAK